MRVFDDHAKNMRQESEVEGRERGGEGKRGRGGERRREGERERWKGKWICYRVDGRSRITVNITNLRLSWHLYRIAYKLFIYLSLCNGCCETAGMISWQQLLLVPEHTENRHDNRAAGVKMSCGGPCLKPQTEYRYFPVVITTCELCAGVLWRHNKRSTGHTS
mgnify:CR=1 FL=1